MDDKTEGDGGQGRPRVLRKPSPEDNDAIDCALSADALYKAAREGERAAAVLLDYAADLDGVVVFLARIMKEALVASPGDLGDPVPIRMALALTMSAAALEPASPPQMRRVAWAYLASDP
jgi:hypothetical protein